MIDDKNISYTLKFKNEDFEVTEIPLLPLLSTQKISSYTYLWLKKNGITTFEAEEALVDFFHIRCSDINAEGLKDEDAVTYQIISIKKLLSEKELENFNKKSKMSIIKKLKIEKIIGYGIAPVVERMLHGNLFKIVIRNLDRDTSSRFWKFCLDNRFITFINYYDSQRFGMKGGPYNTHLIGKAISESNFNKAFIELQKSKGALESINKNKLINNRQYEEIFKTINFKKNKFFLSSYNSFLWNKRASLLIKALNKSKKYNFEHIGELYVPIVPSLKITDICSIKGYNLSLPLFTLNKEIIKRNLCVTTTVFPLRIENDEIYKKKKKITVSFFLPTGCYATMLIKQIFVKLIR